MELLNKETIRGNNYGFFIKNKNSTIPTKQTIKVEKINKEEVKIEINLIMKINNIIQKTSKILDKEIKANIK